MKVETRVTCVFLLNQISKNAPPLDIYKKRRLRNDGRVIVRNWKGDRRRSLATQHPHTFRRSRQKLLAAFPYLYRSRIRSVDSC